MNFLSKLLQQKHHAQRPEENVFHSLSSDLSVNVNAFKDAFSYPENNSLKVREIYIPVLNSEAVIFFIEGTAHTHTIEKHIIEPLLDPSLVLPSLDDLSKSLLRGALTTATGYPVHDFRDCLNSLFNGNTLILFEGSSEALSMDTPGFETRSISPPQNENVLIGPKEAFVESAYTNRSLLRKHIKNENLIFETVVIDERSKNPLSLVYLKDVANPDLVLKVKERITQVGGNSVQTLSILAQHIEERPYSIVPSTIITERPDRACSFILDGHIAILMENAPYALVVPVTFWALFQTAEDMYTRWAYGNFIRLVRLLAIMVALLLPSFYVAVSTFHEEMIHTDLLLAIAATRERVPFPALLEVLIMEAAFELVREAGIRIPTVMGPTIGIVGALILGQAAVDANIISPILVIVVALTGLSSFAIPEINFNFGVRVLRFVVLFISAFLGFYGMALFLISLLAYLVSLKSFDVPFLSPLAPYTRSSNDLITRPPVWKLWLRPATAKSNNPVRGNKPKGNSRQ
ncbi:spore germination protein [Paenibacillus anseongense]|uniref:spore germination protein n=1 Tax=Paenibacillus anseongense TaxID=2682845 RepID=UPI002DBECE59|nr:spore germination protein [Paenibacillus anseongense]MEC0267013.1 spore germination protein [Paenibacillus anseongense]